MDKAVRTVIFVLLVLSACTHRPPPVEAQNMFVWGCANAQSFSVYYDAAGSAVVSAANEKYVLPPTPSGSGARFAAGEVEFWEHQGKATLAGTNSGPYRDCVPGAQ